MTSECDVACLILRAYFRNVRQERCMSNLFGKKLSPKIVGSSGMERQTPTHVVSDQDLYYLHRSMSIYF